MRQVPIRSRRNTRRRRCLDRSGPRSRGTPGPTRVTIPSGERGVPPKARLPSNRAGDCVLCDPGLQRVVAVRLPATATVEPPARWRDQHRWSDRRSACGQGSRCHHVEGARQGIRRRYASVRALRDDIQAFRRGDTIHSRAPGALDMLRMTVRRQRAILASLDPRGVPLQPRAGRAPRSSGVGCPACKGIAGRVRDPGLHLPARDRAGHGHTESPKRDRCPPSSGRASRRPAGNWPAGPRLDDHPSGVRSGRGVRCTSGLDLVPRLRCVQRPAPDRFERPDRRSVVSPRWQTSGNPRGPRCRSSLRKVPPIRRSDRHGRSRWRSDVLEGGRLFPRRLAPYARCLCLRSRMDGQRPGDDHELGGRRR